MTEDATPASPVQLGRPRDPDLDNRAIAAALEIYGVQGYSGFTFGRVAERARVGKSSLYLRWPTKDDLLGDAFEHIDKAFQGEEATIRDLPFAARVVSVVTQRLNVYLGPLGVASLRLLVDHVAKPNEVGELWKRSAAKSLARAEDRYVRAIAEGDLREDAPAAHLARSVEGAAMVQALAIPPAGRAAARKDIRADALGIVRANVLPWLTETGLAGLPQA